MVRRDRPFIVGVGIGAAIAVPIKSQQRIPFENKGCNRVDDRSFDVVLNESKREWKIYRSSS
jgi:hypothetical protein